jgi:phage tail protein X
LKKEISVASTEAPISITVKTSAGSLVTVRAEHGDELDQLVSSALDAIKSAVTELEAAAKGVAPVQNQPMAPAQVAASLGASIIDNTPVASGGWGSAPSINGRNCPHGKMTAIQGTGKDGQMYRGYFCAAQKGAIDKCRNQYVRAGSPEWNTFVAEQVK